MAKTETEPTYGTFERDGKTRVAYSPGEAVELRYRGYAEKTTAAKTTAADSDTKKS